MKISISPHIFDLFPNYCRGVIVAWGVNNPDQNPVLEAELRQLEGMTRMDPVRRDFKNIPRVGTWLRAFEQIGANPKETPPSIVGLMKRVSSGARLSFISSLVTLFNVQSLGRMLPCGGDDLSTVTGDLCLRLATGVERYVPLGKPDQLERPSPGEIVYADAGDEVLCRLWCWRNSHVTRIQPSTSFVAINVDALPPVGQEEARQVSEDLGGRVQKYCGGSFQTFLLTRESPTAEFDSRSVRTPLNV